MKIAMSSGHSKYLSGAVGPSPWGLHEHTEAVALVNQTAIEMRALGLEVVTYEDTVSKNVSDNLDRLISWHNQQVRDVDLSIHLNASEPTQGVRGHECWYTSDKGKQIAQAIVGPVCAAAGFKNRGVKHTDDLAWLNGTAMPSCLLEICFVDARGDVDLYQAQGAFGAICSAIAGALAGSESAPGPEPAPGVWIDDITATVFGGAADNENSAYPPYDLLNDTDLYLSLPYKFPGERPMVEVMNPANGEIRAAPIRDVGPWMIDDDYFRRGTRPPGPVSMRPNSLLLARIRWAWRTSSSFRPVRKIRCRARIGQRLPIAICRSRSGIRPPHQGRGPDTARRYRARMAPMRSPRTLSMSS